MSTLSNPTTRHTAAADITRAATPLASATPAAPKRASGLLGPIVRRWLAAGMLLAAALLATLYIANAIAVNSLLADIASLERERDDVRRENERMRSELLKLMSVDRITAIASQHLGMVQPMRPPQDMVPSSFGAGTAQLPVAGDSAEVAGQRAGDSAR